MRPGMLYMPGMIFLYGVFQFDIAINDSSDYMNILGKLHFISQDSEKNIKLKKERKGGV